MKINYVRLIEHCIEDGVDDAMNCRKDDWSDSRLREAIMQYIMIGIDYYFTFEDND
jgi:hypothetical protein